MFVVGSYGDDRKFLTSLRVFCCLNFLLLLFGWLRVPISISRSVVAPAEAVDLCLRAKWGMLRFETTGDGVMDSQLVRVQCLDDRCEQ